MSGGTSAPQIPVSQPSDMPGRLAAAHAAARAATMVCVIDPDALLAEPALDAAVAALAVRNQHHLQSMSPEEQIEAAVTWRQLSLDVLTAVRAVVVDADDPSQPDPGAKGPGRAVIVLQDTGEDEVGIHVAFHPDLDDLGGDQVAGTPAQITAISLLEPLQADGPGAA